MECSKFEGSGRNAWKFQLKTSCLHAWSSLSCRSSGYREDSRRKSLEAIRFCNTIGPIVLDTSNWQWSLQKRSPRLPQIPHRLPLQIVSEFKKTNKLFQHRNISISICPVTDRLPMVVQRNVRWSALVSTCTEQSVQISSLWHVTCLESSWKISSDFSGNRP